MSRFRPTIALALFAPFFAGCSDESEPSRPACPSTTGPSFRVTITSEDEVLPSDTQVEVVYGAGHEVYSLDDATRAGKAVFCEPSAAFDAAGAPAISCDLWTSGAASLKVSAEGYEPIDETLSAERDECGIKLTEVTRTLERVKKDGGI